ncbi:MAG: type IX secretion system membrane protein PorP/SprF [Flavobacteriales bacterium]|nr:type IX secretion system membrane protein PorP/SprF [Flavobacteriales bacterium]
MKKLTLLFVSIFMGSMLQAQQLPQLSQFMLNDFAVNPAIAGMNDYYQIKTSVRNQWVGIEDAPKTTLLSIYGKSSDHVGLGGSVFNDQVGPTSRAGASLTYAYHLNFTDEVKMSMALSGGFTQFKIDKVGWNTFHTDDQLMDGAEAVNLVPDATFGLNIYEEDKWYLGIAVPQLLNSKLTLIDEDFANNISLDMDGSLSRHIYVMGMYNLEIDHYWDLQPSVLFKTVSNQNQIDMGLKTIYSDKFWLGMDYRTNGDISALLGFIIQEKFMIGYSYDIPNPDISQYTSGSHEFMFGVTFRPSTQNQIMR